MQYNIDSAECEEKIKNEIECKDLIKNEHIEMIEIYNDKTDYISYENFKLKNEEIDLKFECNDDTDQLTHGCEKVDIGQQISSDKSYMNSAKEEKEHEVNYSEINDSEEVKKSNFLECEIDSITNQIKKDEVFRFRDSVDSNKFTCHSKTNIGNEDIFGVKKLIKLNLDHIAKKMFLKQHRLNHNNSEIFKRQHCTHETHYKGDLIQHTKSYKNVKVFKCTYCSKKFTTKQHLERHLFRIHKCKDDRKKVYNCDQCSYECLSNSALLKHKIKHGVTDGIPVFKCYQCTFETYRKTNLSSHVKTHKNMKDFKCTYCSKEFTKKGNLESHLLRIHKCRDLKKRVKLYNCDHCSYECVGKRDMLQHKIKHGIKDDTLILKCYQCTFDTYHKRTLSEHVKIHQNIKDFKCIYCSKEFNRSCNLTRHIKIHDDIKKFKCTLCSEAFAWRSLLDSHLLKIHECRDVRKIQKLYNCDHCSCDYLTKRDLLQHKIRHGITDDIPVFKCYQCTFETYHKTSLIAHAKTHRNIKDFKCTYCLKEFTHNNSLIKHKKTHSNIKGF